MRFRSRARPEFAGLENKTGKADRIGPKSDRRLHASVIPKSLDDFGKITHFGKTWKKSGRLIGIVYLSPCESLTLNFPFS